MCGLDESTILSGSKLEGKINVEAEAGLELGLEVDLASNKTAEKKQRNTVRTFILPRFHK